MPLVNQFQSGDGFYTTKQQIKLYESSYVNPSEQIKTGHGIFSSFSNLISPITNFASANKDLIQAGVQSTSSVIQAGKAINDAVNSSRKANAEIDLLNKIKKRIELVNKEKEAAINASSNEPNNMTSTLSNEQKSVVINGLKNISKKGKGFRVY